MLCAGGQLPGHRHCTSMLVPTGACAGKPWKFLSAATQVSRVSNRAASGNAARTIDGTIPTFIRYLNHNSLRQRARRGLTSFCPCLLSDVAATIHSSADRHCSRWCPGLPGEVAQTTADCRGFRHAAGLDGSFLQTRVLPTCSLEWPLRSQGAANVVVQMKETKAGGEYTTVRACLARSFKTCRARRAVVKIDAAIGSCGTTGGVVGQS